LKGLRGDNDDSVVNLRYTESNPEDGRDGHDHNTTMSGLPGRSHERGELILQGTTPQSPLPPQNSAPPRQPAPSDPLRDRSYITSLEDKVSSLEKEAARLRAEVSREREERDREREERDKVSQRDRRTIEGLRGKVARMEEKMRRGEAEKARRGESKKEAVKVGNLRSEAMRRKDLIGGRVGGRDVKNGAKIAKNFAKKVKDESDEKNVVEIDLTTTVVDDDAKDDDNGDSEGKLKTKENGYYLTQSGIPTFDVSFQL